MCYYIEGLGFANNRIANGEYWNCHTVILQKCLLGKPVLLFPYRIYPWCWIVIVTNYQQKMLFILTYNLCNTMGGDSLVSIVYYLRLN